MGSVGSSKVTVHVTGFSKFHGVAENPTETIVNNLHGFTRENGLPDGLVLGSCNVIQTAGEGALAALYKLLDSALAGVDAESSNSGKIILAFNEATFSCPDELGWEPHKAPIVPEDGRISQTRQTSLPTDKIIKAMARKGYEVVSSIDAGRFVCNYVYYHSLRFAEEHSIKSLFVHVPLFSTIDEEIQMKFVASLLEVLASIS